MITATTRRCSACSNLVEATDPACVRCGRPLAPPIEEWGDHARRLICLLILVDCVETHLHCTEQQLFEQLLMKAMRGRRYAGRHLPQAASEVECLAEFRTLYARWEAAGSPADFTAVAQLRGAR